MTPEERKEIIRLLEQGQELSPDWARILFPPDKREYELVYHGKEREGEILANTLAVPLQPVRAFGRNNATGWHNMLIFGDNLQVMKSLLEMKKVGKLRNSDGTPGVRLIYIDPPFATRQEFRGSEDQKAYQDKIVGAQFLEFLRKRLILLRELLGDNGTLYLHLDQKKLYQIKQIADEVFEESRFRNHIVWYYTNKIPDSRKGVFTVSTDHILTYGKTREVLFTTLTTKREKPIRVSKFSKVNGDKVYDKDSKGKGIYIERAERVMDNVWQIALLHCQPEVTGFPTQKPEELIRRAIEASTIPGDLVLDAFAGSGTTCAVAEKLGRRWIGIDCGKLAIYTIQKRMLNLRKEIGNKGPMLTPKPFTLFNAGLYDFSKLRNLPWESWRFFALQLFQCREEAHKIGGVSFDGYLKGSSVLVFNHTKNPGALFTEDTLEEIHEAVGSRVGNKLFIIAPALTFGFQQDYIDMGDVRYYALRIPYSIINELHKRGFTALKQPTDEMAVNDTVEAVGFDFIRTPELKYMIGVEMLKGELFEQGFIKIMTFKSDAVVREPVKKRGNLETLSAVMLDFDYDETSRIFGLDEVHYADAIKEDGWKVRFRRELLGKKMMVVFVDIYGNEARVLVDAGDFKPTGKKAGRRK